RVTFQYITRRSLIIRRQSMRAERRYFDIATIIIALLAALGDSAQAPTAIQFFLPGGALPSREIKFTLTHKDGRVEVLFTDTKGKYQLSGDLARESEYTIMIEVGATRRAPSFNWASYTTCNRNTTSRSSPSSNISKTCLTPRRPRRS